MGIGSPSCHVGWQVGRLGGKHLSLEALSLALELLLGALEDG